MDTSTSTPDLTTLIDSLDSAAIRDRLADLDRQERARRTLLLAAMARRRSEAARPARSEEGSAAR